MLRRCSIESLEPRTFLSVSVNDGVLTVTGTEKADQITIRYVRSQITPAISIISLPAYYEVTVNGKVTNVSSFSVKAISVVAYAGDDNINLGGSHPFPIGPVVPNLDAVPVQALIYCG